MGGQLALVLTSVALWLGKMKRSSIMSSSPEKAPTQVARRWKKRCVKRFSPTVCMAMTRMRSASHGLPCRHMHTRPAQKAAGVPACTRMVPATALMACVKSSAGRMPPVLLTQKPRKRLHTLFRLTLLTSVMPYSHDGVAELPHQPRRMM
jgi:hypothetical protein